MSAPETPVTLEMVTEESLTEAILAVLGKSIYDAICDSAGYTAAHDRACMIAFMENRQGRDIEILRLARHFISRKGHYPYYDKTATASQG
jgi:hypothetical protein